MDDTTEIFQLRMKIARLEAMLNKIWSLGINEYSFDYTMYDVEPSDDEIIDMYNTMKKNGEF